jgi:hypothetical protein
LLLVIDKFTINLLPQVTGPELRWKGVGGIQAAGYFGNNWEWREDLSYTNCFY